MFSSSNLERLCDYCGLPVPKLIGAKGDSHSVYCCTGCRFAHAITNESGEEGQNRWILTKLGIAIFFSMNVMVLTIALWAYDGSRFANTPQMANALSEVFRFACLLLTFPVLVLLGRPLAEQAIDGLRQRWFSTDLLILSGVLASFVYSTISVWRGAGDIYFEVGCMILVFVTLGRWLEATGKLRSTSALDQLQRLLPDEVLLQHDDRSRTYISRSELHPGHRFVVKPGERIPIDGMVVEGSTTVDEQLMTGESWPVQRVNGQRVIGGTVVLGDEVVVLVDVIQQETVLQRLVDAVTQARQQKSDVQRLADRISQYFLPLTLLLATGTLIFHIYTADLMTGLLAALSVVLIACPCGLGLATPMVLWAAVGVAAKRGIAFNSTQVLESLSKVQAIRFDKTGTLTTGTPTVHSVSCDDVTPRSEINQRVKQLAQSSNHVFSKAISSYITDGFSQEIRGIKNHSGKGVSGIANWERQPTALGNLALMTELGIDCPDQLIEVVRRAEQDGQPIVLIGWGGFVRATFTFQEQAREAVQETLSKCCQLGLNLGILTGDSSTAACRFAESTELEVLSGLSPTEKQAEIQKVQNTIGRTALIGDGINDVVALSTADVGICLGCGADVSRDAADICLVSDDLAQLPWLIEMSRDAMQTIRTNLTWSFTYNGVGMAIATTGWLHPAVAAGLMVASSLFVISNSLRFQASYSTQENRPATPDIQANGATIQHQFAATPTALAANEVQCG